MAVDPRDWPHLTESARAALLEAAQLLAGGFTGKIVIEAAQGGVRSLEAGHRWTGEEMVRRQNATVARPES